MTRREVRVERSDLDERQPIRAAVGEPSEGDVGGQRAVVEVVDDRSATVVEPDRSAEGIQLETGVQRPLARLGIGPEQQPAAAADVRARRDFPLGRVGVVDGQEHAAQVDRRSRAVVDLDPGVEIACFVRVDRGVDRQHLVDEQPWKRTDRAHHAVGRSGGSAVPAAGAPVGQPAVRSAPCRSAPATARCRPETPATGRRRRRTPRGRSRSRRDRAA